MIEEIHNESPDKGYRRIRDDLDRYHNITVNDKRVLRICRKKGLNLQSSIGIRDALDRQIIHSFSRKHIES